MALGRVSSIAGTEESASYRLSKCTTASPVRVGRSTTPSFSSVITARVPSEPHTIFARLKRGSRG